MEKSNHVQCQLCSSQSIVCINVITALPYGSAKNILKYQFWVFGSILYLMKVNI